ncbi:phosphoglycolate phosphatase [Alcaligenaceae bacterium]|nr:phosphoglycolate phosphatase [Alcaligenaceae bacterium]
MRFSAVLLDLDGTLLDTIPDLTRASNAMRIELGMDELPISTVATYVGKGTENLVKKLLADNPEGKQPSADETTRALRIFHHHYHRVNGDEATVYPGVIEGLDAFSDAGSALAVVTNKPTEFTLPLLERMGLASYFSQVVCGDTCARKKPDPMPFLHACELLGAEPAESLAIGDSINDALAARAANMTVLALPYGYNEGMDVRNLPVDDIVMSIAEAAQWAADR